MRSFKSNRRSRGDVLVLVAATAVAGLAAVVMGAVPEPPKSADAAVSITLSGPAQNVNHNANFDVQLVTGDITGRSVLSFEAELSWDPNALTLVTPYFAKSGLTNRSDWLFEVDATSPGRARVGAYGSGALSGSGVLGLLKFRATGPAGAWTILELTSFQFNEDNVTVSAASTRIALTPSGSPCVRVAALSQRVGGDQSFCVPISIGTPQAPTTGLNIRSFQGTLTWDPAVADFDPAANPVVEKDITGPAATWMIEFDASRPGRLAVGGYGESAMTGSGPLFCIHMKSKSQPGTTPLVFSNTFLLNEGSPCAAAADSTVIVPVQPVTWSALKTRFH